MSTIKRSRNNRRRFSDEQIKSLETMFDTESRPELRLKMNLANRLGLQPRQVAIWFQNKRARSKSKQIENEYAVLKTKFDELSSQFDILRKENQTLLIQLQRLRNMAGKKDDEVLEDCKDRINIATSENPEILRAHSDELFMPLCDDAGKTVDYMEETDFLNMAHAAQDSLTSPDNGCSFDSCTFLDHNPGYSSQWWDF